MSDFEEEKHPRDAHGQFSAGGLSNFAEKHAGLGSAHEKPVTKEALDAHVQTVQNINKMGGAKHTITAEVGKKYAKIMKQDGADKSVHHFVDMTNGNILKAASSKAPAAGVRGNIHDSESVKARVRPFTAS